MFTVSLNSSNILKAFESKTKLSFAANGKYCKWINNQDFSFIRHLSHLFHVFYQEQRSECFEHAIRQLRRSCTNSPAPTPTRTSTSSFSSLLSWLQSKAFLQGLTSRAMTAVQHRGDVSWTVHTDPWTMSKNYPIHLICILLYAYRKCAQIKWNVGSNV